MIISCSSYLQAQTPDWNWIHSGGGEGSEHGRIELDSKGHLIHIGYFTSSYLIQGTDTLTSFGDADIFISKYDSLGNLLWLKNYGGTGQDLTYSITIDETDCFYISGYFRSDSISFDTITLHHQGAIGATNFYIVKFSSSGVPLRAITHHGSGYSNGVDVSYKNGFLYSTGWFQGDSLLIGNSYFSNQNNSTFFLTKYDTLGTPLWSRTVSGSNANGLSNSQGLNIAVDENDYVTIAGTFNIDTLQFGSLSIYSNNPSNCDLFLVRYSPVGTEQWIRTATGSGWDIPTEIASGINGDIVLVGGFTSSAIHFHSDSLINIGSYDFFIARYDMNGNEIWTKSYGTSLHDNCFGLTIDETGNIILGGHFSSNSITMDGITLLNSGEADGFIGKFDSLCNAIWLKKFGGPEYDGIRDVLTSSGNVYFGGSAKESTLNFDSDSLVIPTNNYYDYILGKLGFCNHHATIAVLPDTILCNGVSVNLTAGQMDQYLWNTQENTQTINASVGGTYYVNMLDSTGCIFSDTALVTAYNPSLYTLSFGNDTSLCQEDFPFILSVPNINFDTYLWSNGSTDTSIFVSQAGVYYVHATYACGSVGDSIEFITHPTPFINLGQDTTICPNTFFTLNAPPALWYLWSTGDTIMNLSINNPGLYSVTITDSAGCVNTDSISINVINASDYVLNLDSLIQVCDSAFPLLLETSNTNFYTYQWNTGDSGMSLQVTDSGLFVLYADYACGTVIDTSRVTINPNPSPDLGSDTGFCHGELYSLSVNTYISYLWNNGSTEQHLLISASGIYSVIVTNEFGCSGSDQIVIQQFQTYPVLLPPDTSLQYNNPILIQANEGFSEYIWSDGTYGPSNLISEPGIYMIQASDMNGCKSQDTILVTKNNQPMIIPSLIYQHDKFRIINLLPDCELQLFTIHGQIIYNQPNYNNQTIPFFASGIYVIRLKEPEGTIIEQKLVVIN